VEAEAAGHLFAAMALGKLLRAIDGIIEAAVFQRITGTDR
jgi:hypothetical protein